MKRHDLSKFSRFSISKCSAKDLDGRVVKSKNEPTFQRSLDHQNLLPRVAMLHSLCSLATVLGFPEGFRRFPASFLGFPQGFLRVSTGLPNIMQGFSEFLRIHGFRMGFCRISAEFAGFVQVFQFTEGFPRFLRVFFVFLQICLGGWPGFLFFRKF